MERIAGSAYDILPQGIGNQKLPPKLSDRFTLYISNLTKDTTEADVQTFFSQVYYKSE